MPLEPGSRLGSHRIIAPIGAGGMGEVYRARHRKLGRDVAIKVLPDAVADDPERLARFEREARTASALNHPNIVTIHDIADEGDTTYLVMELVEGRTLRDLLGDDPLPISRILDIAIQVCEGLAKAHEAGVVHRDVKPGNVMLTPDGLVKILDFGLARPLTRGDGDELDITTLTHAIHGGALMGSPHYMSPEQLSNVDLDHRSDQFAFGVLLYELVAGSPPFRGSSIPAIIGSVISKTPPPLYDLRDDVPGALNRIIGRCLQKDPSERYDSMEEVGTELRALKHRIDGTDASLIAALRKPTVLGPLAALTVGALAWVTFWSLGAERRWAEQEALGEVRELIESGDLYGAYRTALRAQEHRPDDPELQRAFERITLPVTVKTEPPGATFSLKRYANPDAPWMTMGETPLELRVPYTLADWRLAREGFEPFEGAPFGGGSFRNLGRGLVLDSAGTRPPGTVRIPGGPLERIPLAATRPRVPLAPYYLERHEVTNREFAEFVEAGGYETRKWWPDTFLREGRQVPWPEAVDAFRDPTGRHGPSTWELGDHLDGEGELPVSGISWFEARAYCAWAGRSLPTVFHWFQAIGQDQRSDILLHSNVDGEAKAPVGAFRGQSAYGAYDMAGNVREWTWNELDGLRYVLGGAWNEPVYLFRHLVAVDPWDRDPAYGVRCVEYTEEPSQELTSTVRPLREYTAPEPISDEAFEILRGLYDYDREPLDARVEGVDSLPSYRRERVSIRTAYADERMEVNLLIPHDMSPPYSAVVWYPGDDVFALRSGDQFSSSWLFDFLPRAGRAVVYPVYRGMHERYEEWSRTPNDWRNMVISWAQDIGRAIDYLETRDDFDADEVAYYGFSAGGLYGPVFMSVEPRIRAAIFIGGGLVPVQADPGMHPAHFAPRTDTPVLMINGDNDFIMPYEEAQLPYFRLLGAPDSLKRHARLPGGHIPSDTRDVMREVLSWLDRHLGPVER